ncbi:MAG: cob(I)yrinic acid a,c-diamide adenosyltransferase [Elusimicrobia bacterium]|nr:cob(I)yrinic acid a,c-diamide adenosyltransferase [Elusimicrobiota bacterium]MBP9699134.1 cob(I)yrinic acid a,c-diamide adenosyltransferase [Elusimicrobiota bacterium]
MKIYTKVGDGGDTYLFGGEKVRKDHPRVMAYGDVDELNSLLGWAASFTEDEEFRKVLSRLQNELFVLGADLATPRTARLSKRVPRIGPCHVVELEKGIDRLSAELPRLTHFILPGGSVVGSALHLARAVCRRAERALAPMVGSDKTVRPAQIYMNRLSDFLFVLARHANLKSTVSETPWIPGFKREPSKSRLRNQK